MPVSRGDTEAIDGLALEVELDQDGRLIAHHPRVMARLDYDPGRSAEVEAAAVWVLAAQVSASEEPDVGVHAPVGAHKGLDIGRPAGTDWVDQPLHPGATGAYDVGLCAREVLVNGADNRLQEHIAFATQRR